MTILYLLTPKDGKSSASISGVDNKMLAFAHPQLLIFVQEMCSVSMFESDSVSGFATHSGQSK